MSNSYAAEAKASHRDSSGSTGPGAGMPHVDSRKYSHAGPSSAEKGSGCTRHQTLELKTEKESAKLPKKSEDKDLKELEEALENTRDEEGEVEARILDHGGIVIEEAELSDEEAFFYGLISDGYDNGYSSLSAYQEGMSIVQGFVTYTGEDLKWSDQEDETVASHTHDVEKGFDCDVMDHLMKATRMSEITGIETAWIHPDVRERHALLKGTLEYHNILRLKYDLFYT
ncbi:hypothetical protein GF351_02510 [Candidatus Woesearchaeota archaeon]|nr:hypothetical protein [Candidatus Woesearchaeota archaeon]